MFQTTNPPDKDFIDLLKKHKSAKKKKLAAPKIEVLNETDASVAQEFSRVVEKKSVKTPHKRKNLITVPSSAICFKNKATLSSAKSPTKNLQKVASTQIEKQS